MAKELPTENLHCTVNDISLTAWGQIEKATYWVSPQICDALKSDLISSISMLLACAAVWITLRTYLISKLDMQYANLHAIFRDFLKQDLDFRNQQINDSKTIDLIAPPNSSLILDENGKIIKRKDIVKSIVDFEIQRPFSIKDFSKEDVENSKKMMKTVDPVLLRLIALKLYTIEEIFNIVRSLSSPSSRIVRMFLNFIFILGKERFGSAFAKEWKETLRYHMQCDPILTARGLTIYGDCYSRRFKDFALKYCKMDHILCTLGADSLKKRKNPLDPTIWEADFRIFEDNRGIGFLQSLVSRIRAIVGMSNDHPSQEKT